MERLSEIARSRIGSQSEPHSGSPERDEIVQVDIANKQSFFTPYQADLANHAWSLRHENVHMTRNYIDLYFESLNPLCKCRSSPLQKRLLIPIHRSMR